jgi:hypothetical protein
MTQILSHKEIHCDIIPHIITSNLLIEKWTKVLSFTGILLLQLYRSDWVLSFQVGPRAVRAYHFECQSSFYSQAYTFKLNSNIETSRAANDLQTTAYMIQQHRGATDRVFFKASYLGAD